MELVIVLVAIVCACIAAAVQRDRGGGVSGIVGGAFLGLILGPIGVLIAFISGGEKCPFCQSKIHPKAIKCPKCQADLTQRPPEQTPKQMPVAEEVPKARTWGRPPWEKP